MTESWLKEPTVFDDIELLSKPIGELTEEDMRKMPHNAMYEGCGVCDSCSLNINTDEAYCDNADGKEIKLKRGQGRPSWCPLRQEVKKWQKGKKNESTEGSYRKIRD